MMPTEYFLAHIWMIPLFPLAGAALRLCIGRRLPNSAVNVACVGSVFLSMCFAFGAIWQLIARPVAERVVSFTLFDWVPAGAMHTNAGRLLNFNVPWGVLMDPLTAVMLLVVTGVGFLLHVYYTGYMAHEGGYYRFFGYLNLFMFSMLTLVLANNLLLLFVGWEGVGLCSYLLIGFYFLRKSASDAGKKAFIVNRIGDAGFLLGLFLMLGTLGTIQFTELGPAIAAGHFAIGDATLTAIALLLFVGATGKSAQLPLYVWLPDAMEGPTPVSALIHAATMVTAGVYVVARSHVLFSHAPTAMYIVAIVGCATAFFAATIGLVQSDIKKVLAYSTVSQLGYMFLACGVGAVGAGIFHLMTHAFFKALLFLSAGSVIHAMGGEQDMWHMGGLRKKIKVTFACMLAGTIAIAGFPPFAGFFSKDAILFAAYNHEPGGKALYAVGLAAAILTSFYMFRLIFLTFYSQQRFDEHKVHVHESPRSMTVPLMILAVLSLVGGWFALPSFFGGKDLFAEFLAPVFAGTMESAGAEVAHSLELILSGVAVAGALVGAVAAWSMYGKSAERGTSTGLHKLLYNKYYVDELYDALIVVPLVWLSRNILWKVVDVGVIDGTVNGIAHGANAIGDASRHTQSGNARSYAVWILIGALVIFVIIFWPLFGPAGGVR